MMCVIVDADVAHLVFLPNTQQDFELIYNDLYSPRGITQVVFGGKNGRELANCVGEQLRVLEQAGKARKVDDNEIDKQEIVFGASSLESNDPHVLALATVSGVRLLCTHDKALMRDFKNKSLINPPGSIFCKSSHKHLIRQHCAAKNKV